MSRFRINGVASRKKAIFATKTKRKRQFSPSERFTKANQNHCCHIERSEISKEFKTHFLNLWILRLTPQYDKVGFVILSVAKNLFF